MFRTSLRPSPVGFFLGIAVIAFWFALWVWFLAGVATVPREQPRHRFPELTVNELVSPSPAQPTGGSLRLV